MSRGWNINVVCLERNIMLSDLISLLCKKWAKQETCRCPYCNCAVLSCQRKVRLRSFHSILCPNCENKLWLHPLEILPIIAVLTVCSSLFWGVIYFLSIWKTSLSLSVGIVFFVSLILFVLGAAASFFIRCRTPLVPATFKIIRESRPL